MPKGEKPILSVRIDQEILDQLNDFAEEIGVGRAEVVERCLGLGLAQDEKLASLLKGKITGPFLEFLTHPKFLKSVLHLLGQELDPTALAIREAAGRKRRGAGNPKLVSD